MTTPADTPDNASTQERQALGAAPVPTPAGGVRGADQVDRMDSEPREGTTTGADGQTAAREALRKDLVERSAAGGTEAGDDLEQAAALGGTDDPRGGSIQPGGATP